MPTRGGTGLRARLFAAGALIFASFAASADPPLPLPLQTTIVSAIDSAETQPEQCPAPDALSSLADTHPDFAVAIASFTASRLRADRAGAGGTGATPAGGGDSRCNCVAALTGALAPVAPERSGEIRDAFADSFPDCGAEVSEAIEQSLAGAPAGSGIGLFDLPNIPKLSPFGDPSPKCKTNCTLVEPAPGDTASRTAL